MTMITHDIEARFPNKNKSGMRTIYATMDWINRNTTPDFCQYFALQETGENISMMTLRKEVNLEQFLEYHGHTFEEAITKFRLLKLGYERRSTSDDQEIYRNISEIETFYREIEAGNKPEYIVLSCVEHY